MSPMPPDPADALDAPPDPRPLGSMGLGGLWQTVGNATAMVVICVVFVWLLRDMLDQSRSDRALFRDELRAIRQTDEKRYEMLVNATDRRVQVMTGSLDRAVDEMRRAVEAIEASTRPPRKE